MKPQFNHIFFLALFVHLNLLLAPIIAQDKPQNNIEQILYESAKFQVANLVLKEDLQDSLVFDLIKDAEDFAKKNYWKEAREILETIFDLHEYQPLDEKYEDALFTESSSKDNLYYNISSAADPNSYLLSRWQIESGIDYTTQEFELSLTDDDSILMQKYQNPYFAVSYFQPIGSGNLNHRFRIDNQFLNYNFYGTIENKTINHLSRFEFEGSYFLSQTNEDSDFLDTRILYQYGNPYSLKNRWYLNLNSRFKWYPKPDSLFGNITNAGINFYFEHAINLFQSVNFFVRPSIYNETRNLGNKYFQNWAGAFYRIRENYNRFVEAGMEIIYHKFDNDLGEQKYHNSYVSLMPKLEGEWTFTDRLGIDAKFTFEQRNYSISDAISPNVRQIYLEGRQKIYVDQLRSFGVGAFWEKQSHFVEKISDQAFAQQADYLSYGAIINMEYMELSGILLNLEYQVKWRNYPNAENSFFDFYYSDRLIHSVSLFGWIPIAKKWQLLLFANFDDDSNRDIKQNDNRNTIFNAGLVYKF